MHSPQSIPERFRNKIASEDENGCRLWTGSRDQAGYGKFSVDGKVWYAHKFIWHRLYGNPRGKFICHVDHCKSPSCVRPEHLCLRVTPGGNKKLTADLVRAIRLDTRHAADCCHEYGVSASTILGVRTRKTWKHIL